MRILVIDDEPDVRGMICKMLKNEGFDAVSAANGNEGIRLLNKESKIDIVITDLIMPEKEGIETIRELRQDYSSIKILAISGGGKGKSQDYLAFAKILGADLTLSKPFLKKDLLESLQKLIEAK